MGSKSIKKNSLSFALYFVIFIGLLFFLVQQLNVSNEYKSLEAKNIKLIQNDNSHKDDISKIIVTNIAPHSIITDTVFRSDKIYLCVDYPVCAPCFVDVNHFLYAYAKKNKKELTLLCRTEYIQEVRKVLKFESLGQIEVDALIDMDNSDIKMIVVFNSTEGKQFYLPLPEKREVNFLKSFLK